jgi:outer membrane immunogenic protein
MGFSGAVFNRRTVMRKKLLMLFAGAALGLTASHTSAADLGWRGPSPAPAYLRAPVPYVWTGCYVGGNVGGAWANIEVSNVATGETASASNSGFAGGAQIGCDYQASAPWVVGFRDLLDATSLNNSTTFSSIPFTGTADSRTRWFDTLTARGGYLVLSNLLLYGQGGAAWTNTNVTFFSAGAQVGQFSNDRTGWTVGAGAEWMFVPHWSVFLEYNFMGFGTQSAAFTACGGSCVLSTKANIQDALVGINYKF